MRNVCFVLLLTIICLALNQSAHAQCREDLFGRWEDLKGELSIYTPEFNGKPFSPLLCTLRIKSLDIETWGSFYYSGKGVLTMRTYLTRSIRDTSSRELKGYLLEFAVRRNTHQELKIRPYNEEAIQLLGHKTIEFFNQDYINWDDIELNKLYFSMPNGRYSVDLKSGVAYKKKRVGKWKKQKYRYYTRELDHDFLDTLRANVLKSNIMYMSVCDRKWKSASDTMSKFIAIDYNGRVVNFTTYYLYDSVYPLYYSMAKVAYDLKWKRVRTIDTATSEFDYFYHYGTK